MNYKKILAIIILSIVLISIFFYSENENIDTISYQKDLKNNKTEDTTEDVKKQGLKEIKKEQTDDNNRYFIKIRGGLKVKIKVKQISGVGINNGYWEIYNKPFGNREENYQKGCFTAGNGKSYTTILNGFNIFGKIEVKVNINNQYKSKSGFILFGFVIFI